MMSSASSKKTGSIHAQWVSRYKRWKSTPRRVILLYCLIISGLITWVSYWDPPVWVLLLEPRSWVLLLAFVLMVAGLHMTEQYQFQRLRWVLDNVTPVESTIVLKHTGNKYISSGHYLAEFGSAVQLSNKRSTRMELCQPHKRLQSLFTGDGLHAKVYFDPDSGHPLAIETSQGLLRSRRLTCLLMFSLYVPDNGSRRLNWPAILFALAFALLLAAWELKIM